MLSKFSDTYSTYRSLKAIPEVCYTDSNPQCTYIPNRRAKSATAGSTVCSRIEIPSTSPKFTSFSKVTLQELPQSLPLSVLAWTLGHTLTTHKHIGSCGKTLLSFQTPIRPKSLQLHLALAVTNQPKITAVLGFVWWGFFILLDMK